MNTYSPKSSQVVRHWHLIDARDQVLGRLASQVAQILMGKHKPDFSRHLDMGDRVVVINASAVRVTGKKATSKLYRRHSGYPGGLKETPLKKMYLTYPERIITHAVSGMLPKNKLHQKLLGHLHVYANDKHPYDQHFSSSHGH